MIADPDSLSGFRRHAREFERLSRRTVHSFDFFYNFVR